MWCTAFVLCALSPLQYLSKYFALQACLMVKLIFKTVHILLNSKKLKMRKFAKNKFTEKDIPNIPFRSHPQLIPYSISTYYESKQ